MALAETCPPAACMGGHAHGLEAAPIDTREGIGKGSSQAGQLAAKSGPVAKQEIRAEQEDYAGETGQQGGDLGAIDPFIARRDVGDDKGEQGRGGIKDRGQSGGNMGLAPEDQAEGDQVVQQPHEHEGGPGRFAPEEALAGQPEPQIQCECGKGDAPEDDRQRA